MRLLLLAVAAAGLAGTTAKAPQSAAAEWFNWNTLQHCEPWTFSRPTTEAQVADLVRAASAAGHRIKTVGAGHSFSGITLTDGLMLQLDALDAPLSVTPLDPSAPWTPGSPSKPASGSAAVEVQAGMRVHVLNSFLASKGLALENTGAIALQSVAGATSTSTHGTGRNLGSMATSILGLRLVLANGTVLDASASLNPGVFRVARVGLGALGVIVRVTVRAVPLFKLRRTATPYSLKELLPWVWPQAFDRWERMQWYFTPRTDSATLLLREAVPFDTPIVDCWNGSAKLAWRDPFADKVADWHPYANASDVQVVSGPEGPTPVVPQASRRRGDTQAGGAEPVPTGPSVECVDLSYRALAHQTDDYDLYEEMEVFVDANASQALMEEFIAFQNSTPLPPQPAGSQPWAKYALFTGMRYVAKDDIALSMMNGRDTGVISFITLGNHTHPADPSTFAHFAEQLERLSNADGGRWHWGKMNWATAADTARVYPASSVSQFLELRAQLDPSGAFLDDYLVQRLPNTGSVAR
ncbi:hypothetical protein FNF29_07522 [Cafeteria roenbergensis]|uniref:FAD-binding PCMH-type domain-containing protein n=1 Tax=Cafeteria roenbergensis TaxID=33653 RepID=A0A5A8C5U9_CAFRO|nr:hypothetical protein FNF29_07522 [Cafeteria roenbergensis]|eukprot:KAA0147261.1 hypothetical protein FNF29_07522 [Cafeteria roenbergensis]